MTPRFYQSPPAAGFDQCWREPAVEVDAVPRGRPAAIGGLVRSGARNSAGSIDASSGGVLRAAARRARRRWPRRLRSVDGGHREARRR